MAQQVEHDKSVSLTVIGPAVKYGSFDIASDWTAQPLVGEHTEAISKDWLGKK
jgi:crotonobetainyl-CoA:carnitine CoA-transferase CaiB-like acyl-CoA transferase